MTWNFQIETFKLKVEPISLWHFVKSPKAAVSQYHSRRLFMIIQIIRAESFDSWTHLTWILSSAFHAWVSVFLKLCLAFKKTDFKAALPETLERSMIELFNRF